MPFTLLDGKNALFQAVAHEGIDLERFPNIELDKRIIGRVGDTGESYFIDNLESYSLGYDHPMVCIPLKIKDHVIGVIVIYKLLVQKSRFADVDYELFTLLAGYATPAIFSSHLYSDSARKLSTAQGFIDLLTK